MGEKLGYRPALDGVRAISIALVLVFHLGAPWLPGGYLGVSVFFTLSGFLITSLLLTERASTGRIDVRAFYVRRLRRLLPASLICLSGIAVLASVGTIAERTDLRTGVIAAVFQVANWEHLLGDRSYADLFLAPSPVDHFWSLAIEEQFYWVWPIAVAGLTARAAGRSVARVLVGAFVALGIAAVVTASTLGGDAAYFASWARFAEILAGAALAAVVAGRGIPSWAARLALPSLIAVVALSFVTPAGRGWAYEGGLPVFALASAGLILGVLAPGRVARALAREPIPWIGRISYGLYLFHWPVFTILGDASVGEKLALTFGITVVSYYAIERPIRTGSVLPAPTMLLRGAAGALVAVAVAVTVLIPTVQTERRSTEPTVIVATGIGDAAGEPVTTPTTTVASIVIGSSDEPSVAAPASTTSTTVPPPLVVALFGDSVADWLLRDASATFRRTDITLVDAAVEGCDGAAEVPIARGRQGQVLPLPDDCRPWPDAYPAAAENPLLPIDVAVLMVGYAPMVDRLVGGRWIGPCDSAQWYVDDLHARVGYLRARADRVVLALPSWGGKKSSFLTSDDHLVRMGCIRAQLRSFAADTGVEAVDLAELLCPAGPEGECSNLREDDGAHVDAEDAPIVLEWLLDRVV